MTRRDEYLETMESLFGHPGWRHIVDDATKQIYQLQADALDPKVCKTWDDVNVARGRALQLNELVLLPEVLETIRVNSAETEE